MEKMFGRHRRSIKKAGASPGTLVHIGEQKAEKVQITLFDYDRDRLEEKELPTIEEAFSFQEKAGDIFNLIRERLRNQESRLRKNGADYLAYRLLDTIVDHYFTILENMGEKIVEVEEELMKNPTTDTLAEIHRLKREIISLRKSIWPLREIISSLEREDSPLIKDSTEIFLRDVYDHAIQVMVIYFKKKKWF